MLNVSTVASYACFAGSLYVGRNFVASACYQGIATAAGLIGNNDVAEECEQRSQDYWKLAKKNAPHDAAIAVGLIGLGLVSSAVGKSHPPAQEQNKPPVQELKEEPGYVEYYGTPMLKVTDFVVSSVSNYIVFPTLKKMLEYPGVTLFMAAGFHSQRIAIGNWAGPRITAFAQGALQIQIDCATRMREIALRYFS